MRPASCLHCDRCEGYCRLDAAAVARLTAGTTLRAENWLQLLRQAGRYPGLLHVGASPDTVARIASGQIYLASPYSLQVTDPVSRRWSRWRSREMAASATLHVAALASRGITAVSPIIQSAAICDLLTEFDPLDERFWGAWCQPMLDASRAVVVPDIPGWRESLGVWREVVWALDRNVPVHVYGRAEG